MKKFVSCFLIFLVLSSIALPKKSEAAMDPKLKAFLITSGYGVAGGALLGVASVALGAKARAIAQGASLGLYAGMIFGAYIIFSHQYAQGQPTGEYQDAVSPYADPGESSPFAGEDDPYAAPSDGGAYDYRFRNDRGISSFKNKKGGNNLPIYFNVINVTF